MSTTSERRDRAEEAHREAMAILEHERLAREAKTAKLRELRLARETELRPTEEAKRNVMPPKAASRKLTFDALMAARAEWQKA
jgi:hypothetical protein